MGFVLTVLLLWQNNLLDDSILSNNLRDAHTNGPILSKISIFNALNRSICLYYSDGDTGAYLQDIDQLENIDLLASTGDELYITNINGRDPLSKLRVDGKQLKFEVIDNAGNVLFAPRSKSAFRHTGMFESSASGRTTYVRHNMLHRSEPHAGILAYNRKVYALPVKFRSLSTQELTCYFDDGRGGQFQGTIRFGDDLATTAYVGHRFFFTVPYPAGIEPPKSGDASHGDIVAEVRIIGDQTFYVVWNSGKLPAGEEALLTVEDTNKELDFMARYHKDTGRLHVGARRDAQQRFSPRPPPVLYMWPSGAIGDVHIVSSMEGYWHCDGHPTKCQAQSPDGFPHVQLELQAVSLKPRAFVIDNFLSDYEVESIKSHANRKLRPSSVGNAENTLTSNTRTSKNTWLNRDLSAVINSIFLRAADLLQVDEKLLSSFRRHAAEQLQVVHYEKFQHYDPHYDWAAEKHADRFITLLLYLSNSSEAVGGGHTSFPKGEGIDGNPFQIQPGKGSALLFYNLLPDGNSDINSLHEAVSLPSGEKWLANFWVWDPLIM